MRSTPGAGNKEGRETVPVENSETIIKLTKSQSAFHACRVLALLNNVSAKMPLPAGLLLPLLPSLLGSSFGLGWG